MRPEVSRGGQIAGVLAVAATYVSFLLHAQFGFLALVSQRLGAGRGVEPVMAAMGLAGLLASLLAGAALRVVASRRVILLGFAGCAGVALVSLLCRTALQFGIVAALVGAFTGILTVAIASDLPSLLPGPGLGVKVGIGTGLAYLIANFPPIFHGGPVAQALVPAAGCALAFVALGKRGQSPISPPSAPGPGTGEKLGTVPHFPLSFATLVLAFLALVWLDSAAFRIVQETAELAGRTWGPGARTIGQGVAHLVAAVIAGRLIDRGYFRSLLLATFVMFTLAFALLTSGGAPSAIAGPLYAFGISTYSTALVLAPSLGGTDGDALARRWRAAILYAVAGWAGSALGIGMAQDLHRIPAALTASAGAVLLVGIALQHRERTRALATTFGPALLLASAGIAHALRTESTAGVSPDPIERGRRVYVGEGCIHCHSQFIRPGADELAWGPRRLDQMQEHPPLVGTRRLGPDLLDVGNRRNAAWQRAHLIDPRALAPASRMPSYAHLFARGDMRGDDLVAYLTSLGAATLPQRRAATRAADVPRDASLADAALGRRVFAASCSPCHGAEGHGDGPLAATIASPFLDLRMPGLPRCERVSGDEMQDLERLIRFGSCGTGMAGHELLTDRELVSVTSHVRALRAEASP